MRTAAVFFLAAVAFLVPAAPPASAGGKPGPATIQDVPWQWTGSRYNDGSGIGVPAPGRYVLVLAGDGAAAIRADCNRVRGRYRLDAHRLSIEPGPSTRAMCPPDSLDRPFLKDLAAVQSWMIHNGDLVLMLEYDTGTMRFTRAGP